jgi:hypothetical protein
LQETSEKIVDDNVWIFDFEVTKYDWLFVGKDAESGIYTIIHNDNEEQSAFMDQNPLLCGFNNKHYDDFIIKAILTNCSPEEVKEVNDAIIVDGISGWDIPLIRESRIWFDSFDLMDDCQTGTSLKSIEGHLGMDIEESSVSFDIDHPWNEQELAEMIHYCKADVDATERLYHIRKSYIQNKIALANIKGIPVRKALRMTNAKLTAAFLDARLPDKPRTDEREYKMPPTLKKEYIPQEVLDYFGRMYDPAVSDEELYGRKLEIKVGECPVTIGFGGIHGALPTYTEETCEGRSIRNKDVSSYYPHQMILNGYCSRNIPSPKIYEDVVQTRLKAKKAGDKATANALKLIINTAYGCLLNGNGTEAYNDLYDPLMARSVCISGQLQLLELVEHLLAECPSMKVINLNTDGVMVSLDDCDIPKWEEITKEWESRTGFELEEDLIKKIVQKDVSNYIEVPMEGDSIKIKGSVLVRGISTAGAFKINNNATAVTEAIICYFIGGDNPEEVIKSHDNPLDFQLIAKASHKYTDVWQEVDGEEIPCQRVNRVYASKDHRRGMLYKRHQSGTVTKEPGMPAHCLIDNRNEATIDQIDKDWYVRQAWRLIRDFQGIEQPKIDNRLVNSLMKKSLALF